jgi:phospholipid/cholesterol/gamma-HCH transport system substrate-binding protein
VFKGLSNEFKVGVLAVVSICIFFVGYNFMMGRDNIFTRGRDFFVRYNNTQGLSVGTKVMFNGFKVGMLRSLKMDEDQMIVAKLEITSDMPIPKDSKIKLESALLGGVTLKLILGTSKEQAEDGDELAAEYTSDIFNMVNSRIVNVTNSADSVMGTLNDFFHKDGLNSAIGELPLVLRELTRTIAEIRSTVSMIQPGLASTAKGMGEFSASLPEYDRQLREGLGHFNQLGRQVDSVRVAELLNNLSVSSGKLASLMTKLEAGEGSAGKLLNDDQLYLDILKTSAELQKVMLDLKKYPEKYIPVPGTKKQRKKAKKQSALDTAVWN